MNTLPIVIRGLLVDVKNINTHKCVRLSIDVSAELGAEIVRTFGWPTQVDPVSVAIARLNGEPIQPTAPEPKEPRRMEQLHGGSQAALICKREAFWRFLREQRGQDYCDSEKEAAAIVRSFCEVKSRSEIEMNERAKQRWNLLYSAFLEWMKEPVL